MTDPMFWFLLPMAVWLTSREAIPLRSVQHLGMSVDANFKKIDSFATELFKQVCYWCLLSKCFESFWKADILCKLGFTQPLHRFLLHFINGGFCFSSKVGRPHFMDRFQHVWQRKAGHFTDGETVGNLLFFFVPIWLVRGPEIEPWCLESQFRLRPDDRPQTTSNKDTRL